MYFVPVRQGTFRSNVAEFQAMGVRIITGCDIAVLKSPVSGTPEFMRSCLQGQIREMTELSEGILNLPHKYVALHLLQHCISFNKVQY